MRQLLTGRLQCSFAHACSAECPGVTECVRLYRCIDALIAMGVLVDGGDRVSIRRTAVFFLNSFEASLLSPDCHMLRGL